MVARSVDRSSDGQVVRPERRPTVTDSPRITLPHRDFDLACHCSVWGWGGALTFARGLAAALSRVGQQPLLLGIRPERPVAPLAEAADASDPPAADVPSGLPAGAWRLRHARLPTSLARQLRRQPPPRRAVLALSPTWIRAAKAAWPDVPVIYIFPCLLANCLPFTWHGRRAPTWWTWLDYIAIFVLERGALRRADLTLAPTQQSVEELRAFAPEAAARVERCDFGGPDGARPAGPAERAAARRALGFPDDLFLVALVGKCDLNKAFDRAIRVLPRTAPRIHLVIVGDGPELPALQALAARTRVAPRVRFAGPQRDPSPFYAAADAVLSTSSYDTFPNVLLEGLAAGRPLVVPRHAPPHVYAGFAEVIAAEQCGVLYDARAPHALPDALNALAASPAYAAELGRRGRAAFEQRFTWDHAARRIMGWCGLPDSGPAPCRATPAAATV